MFFPFCCLFSILFFSPVVAFDLTVVGPVLHGDGIGKISVGVIETLCDDVKINCIPMNYSKNGLSRKIQTIVKGRNKKAGTVALYCAPLWSSTSPVMFQKVENSKIKLAYSMLESTSIPLEWVFILNSQFDAVVVPDSFLVDVYEQAGVTIPIFFLPLGMDLTSYDQMPTRTRPSDPFVFGTTVSSDDRKNYGLLIESFAEEFGNNKKVMLKLNTRQGDIKQYKKLIWSLGVSNIQLTSCMLPNKGYLNFIYSFDCFVNISKGEGFSLCPREALALSIPCILTQNTAQTAICKKGLVRAVPSELLEPAFYGKLFGGKQVGYFYNCTKEDVKDALRDVYTNYDEYLKKASNGPEWVSQYRWENLKKKYLNLIKPVEIRLGDHNVVTDEYLMTNSQTLYENYQWTKN